MQKQKLLFVIDSLHIGGGEKSIVTLLSLLDPKKYEIDLQLFGFGGEFEQFVPEYVNILPPIAHINSLKTSIIKQLLSFDIAKVFDRLYYSLAIRKKGLTHIDKARLYWQTQSKHIKNNAKVYDVAIAYAQGMPTYYVADKVKANKKIARINVYYQLNELNREYQRPYYDIFDSITFASDNSREYFNEIYPEFKDKTITIEDILCPSYIVENSKKECVITFDKSTFNIITVARLIQYSKGYDILLQVAQILKDKNINFHWYIVGEGNYRKDMETFIQTNGLNQYLTLLGAKANPYPYMAQADLYVQTSRHEGYGISIAEARSLRIPIVTTSYDGVTAQMKPGKNGIVVPIEAEAVANAIIDLLNNPQKRQEISDFQATEKIGNEEEVEKFNSLVKQI